MSIQIELASTTIRTNKNITKLSRSIKVRNIPNEEIVR